MNAAQAYLQQLQRATGQSARDAFSRAEQQQDRERVLSDVTKWVTIGGGVLVTILFFRAVQS